MRAGQAINESFSVALVAVPSLALPRKCTGKLLLAITDSHLPFKSSLQGWLSGPTSVAFELRPREKPVKNPAKNRGASS